MDEASRAREASFHAVRSTLTATRGKFRAIGNVRGRKNWFYNLSRRAQQGWDQAKYTKLTAFDAVEGGILAMAEIEDAKASLPDHIFKELYLAEPSDDGGNPFGLKAIERCVVPMSDLEPVAFGWDLARAVDFTVGIGLDEVGVVCRFKRYQNTPWIESERTIINYTQGVHAEVDSTGVGDRVIETLQEHGSNFCAYNFSSKSKQHLMQGLQLAIQKGLIGFPDGEIREELENFEYVYSRTGVKYSAPEGLHDDCVMALALAWEAFNAPRIGSEVILI
jgi:phage FluMu gp28-like protein